MEDQNKTVAIRIKQWRKIREIPQIALAKKLNTTATAYNRIENGKTQITIYMLYAIASALDIAVIELLGLPTSSKSAAVMITTDNERVLLSISIEELKKHLAAKQ